MEAQLVKYNMHKIVLVVTKISTLALCWHEANPNSIANQQLNQDLINCL